MRGAAGVQVEVRDEGRLEAVARMVDPKEAVVRDGVAMEAVATAVVVMVVEAMVAVAMAVDTKEEKRADWVVRKVLVARVVKVAEVD